MSKGRSVAHRLAGGADRIGRILETVCGAFCVLCLASMTVIVLLGVFFRYVVNDPFMWTEETARYLQVWMGFVAISIAIKQDKHIKVDVIKSIGPAWLTKAAGFLVDAIMAGFLIVLLNQGYLMVENTLAHASTIPISMVWILAAIPTAAALSLAQLAIIVIKQILNFTAPEASGEAELD